MAHENRRLHHKRGEKTAAHPRRLPPCRRPLRRSHRGRERARPEPRCVHTEPRARSRTTRPRDRERLEPARPADEPTIGPKATARHCQEGSAPQRRPNRSNGRELPARARVPSPGSIHRPGKITHVLCVFCTPPSPNTGGLMTDEASLGRLRAEDGNRRVRGSAPPHTQVGITTRRGHAARATRPPP
jgi:hypothetical protein